jgi:hypothetical protein
MYWNYPDLVGKLFHTKNRIGVDNQVKTQYLANADAFPPYAKQKSALDLIQ